VTVTVTVVGVPPGGGSLRVIVLPETETTVPVTRVTAPAVVVGGVIVGIVVDVVGVVLDVVVGASRRTFTTVPVIMPGVVDVPTTVIRSPAATDANEAGMSSASMSVDARDAG